MTKKILALILTAALCFGLTGQPVSLAAEQGEVLSGVSEAAEAADVDAPDFWEEFHEEYAEDAEYLKWYEHYQQQDGAIKVAASSNDDPFTGKTYDHGSKQECNISRGVDVSYYQGTIDWAKVKKAGVSFAIIRCGRTSYSEKFNILGEDPKLEEYVEGAYKAGIPIGIYYFSQAQTEDEAKQEADCTVKLLKPYQDKITLPVFIDVERGTTSSGADYRINSVSKSQGTKNIKKYCSIVEKAGYTAGVYGNSYDLTHICDYTKLTDYPLWYAHYATKPEFSGDYDYWQYTAGGTVNGISGDVDCNFFYEILTQSVRPPVGSDVGEDGEVTVVEKPAKVMGLKKVDSTKTSITIQWKPVEGATKYRVYCSALKAGTYEALGNTKETSFEAADLKTNYGYYFKVKAYNEAGWGSSSDILGCLTAKGDQRSLYTTSKVNLRKYVGTEYTKLTSIPKNTVLNVKSEQLGTDGGSWFNVSYTDSKGNTYSGYLCGDYVTVGTRARTLAKVKLRSSASSSSDAKVTIGAAKKVIRLSSKKDSSGNKWYKVYYKTGSSVYTGYLLSSQLEKY